MNPQYYGAAAQQNRSVVSKLLSKQTLALAGIFVAVIVALIVGFNIINSLATGPRGDVAKLAARTSQYQALIESNLANITHPTLKKVAAETSLYLTTASSTLKDAYGGTLPESTVKEEIDTTIASRLAEAKTAGKHDAAFLEIMKEKALLTLELAKKVQSQSVGTKSKAAATSTIHIMELTNRQLNELKI